MAFLGYTVCYAQLSSHCMHLVNFYSYMNDNIYSQDPTGRVQEKWSIVLREEETIIQQQFLRFSETRNIAQELLLQENKSLNVRNYTV